MSLVVKRRGKKETFDEKKVYGSVYAACMDCSVGEKLCENIAAKIVADLKKFLKGRKEVNSTEIFGFVIQRLAKEHEPAAFMYETHRDLS
ncbi:MAG TPA: ATP cone domain-containing protein [Candidatus Bilamarchaeum sp.]|nr:ATP cone domain-containing protein [Candidatus Bilamarchaeum sp.]